MGLETLKYEARHIGEQVAGAVAFGNRVHDCKD